MPPRWTWIWLVCAVVMPLQLQDVSFSLSDLGFDQMAAYLTLQNEFENSFGYMYYVDICMYVLLRD